VRPSRHRLRHSAVRYPPSDPLRPMHQRAPQFGRLIGPPTSNNRSASVKTRLPPKPLPSHASPKLPPRCPPLAFDRSPRRRPPSSCHPSDASVHSAIGDRGGLTTTSLRRSNSVHLQPDDRGLATVPSAPLPSTTRTATGQLPLLIIGKLRCTSLVRSVCIVAEGTRYPTHTSTLIT
jgi:hypothetical protein